MVNLENDDTCWEVTDFSQYLVHIKWHDVMVNLESDDTCW
jgi:hypothetical protein